VKLLIAEDIPLSRKLLRAQLEADGHTVVEAANGAEALETLERAPVDGVISDVLMPIMDGFRLCLEIRRNPRLGTLPFVLYTSTHDSPEDRQLAQSVGADGYIAKPSPAPVILEALRMATPEQRALRADAPARPDEVYVLKQYNEALVRKLVERNAEIETAIKHLKEVHEEVRSTEARFRALVENGFDAVSMLKVDGTVLYRSPAAVRVLGYSIEELYGQKPFDLVHPDDLPLANRLFAKLVAIPEERTHSVLRYRHKDGSWRWLEGSGINLLEQPEIGAVVINYRDVTERKLQEQSIENLSRVRAVTTAINSAIVRSHEQQVLFDEACRIAVEHGKFGLAWIGMIDAATREVAAVAWAGIGTEELKRYKTVPGAGAPEEQGTVSRAILECQPAIIEDLAAEPVYPPRGRRRQAMLRLGYHSVISLPLLAENAVVGTLTLCAREPGFFTDEEVRLLTEVAANISFALEHIGRQQKIEKLSRVRAVSSGINSAIVRSRTRQEIFDEACRIAIEHGKFGIAWIGTFDARTFEITPVATAGIEAANPLTREKLVIREDTPQIGSMLGVAIRERRPVYNNDIAADAEVGGKRRQEAVRRGYRSAIALPLIVNGEVFGSCSLFARERGFFDEEEVGLLTELAGNISFALDHMAKQEKIEKLSRVRAVSSGIDVAIVRTHEPQALFEETCRIAVEHGKFELIMIAAVDAERREIQPLAWAGYSAETANGVNWASIDNSQGTVREAILTRKPAVRDDIEGETAIGALRREALDRGFRSIVTLPLVVDDNVVAVITLCAAGRGFFDKDELALFEEVAADVSFALGAMARDRQLAAARERLDLAMRGAGFGVWDWWDVTDPAKVWRSARANELLCLGSEPAPQSLPGLIAQVHPEDLPRIEDAVRATLHDGTPYHIEFRVQRSPGTYHWLRSRGHTIRDASGKVVRLLGVVEDIDELRQIFKAMPGAVIIFNRAGVIDSVNDAAVTLFGYSEDEMTGRPLATVFAPESAPSVSEIETLPADTPVFRAEKLCRGKNGERIPVLYSATRMSGAEAEQRHFICVALDMREQKQLEVELHQAQKLESVGRLAAGIAHEINTPIQFVGDSVHFAKDAMTDLARLIEAYQAALRAITEGAPAAEAGAQLARIEDEIDLPYLQENVPKSLDRVLDGVGRVATIVHAMKDFAHPDQKEMVPVDLNQAILNTLTIARNEYKYVAEVVTELTDLPQVTCHPGEVNQVILNVVVNAAHAIGEIVKDSDRRGLIRVSTRSEGDDVLVTISDTGGGIPEAIRDRVFDPFFTTKDVGRGTGQGLAIARSVVRDKHGGELTFDSEPGKGTTFLIRLPIHGAIQRQAEERP